MKIGLSIVILDHQNQQTLPFIIICTTKRIVTHAKMGDMDHQKLSPT